MMGKKQLRAVAASPNDAYPKKQRGVTVPDVADMGGLVGGGSLRKKPVFDDQCRGNTGVNNSALRRKMETLEVAEQIERFLGTPDNAGADAYDEGAMSATIPCHQDSLDQVANIAGEESAAICTKLPCDGNISDDDSSDAELLRVCKQVEEHSRSHSSAQQKPYYEDGAISATIPVHQDPLHPVANTVGKELAAPCTKIQCDANISDDEPSDSRWLRLCEQVEEQSRSHSVALQGPPDNSMESSDKASSVSAAPQSPPRRVLEEAVAWSPMKAFKHWVPTQRNSTDDEGRIPRERKLPELKARSRVAPVGPVWVGGHYRCLPSERI